MTTTEEIIVSGQDFIERRIFVCPEQEDIANMRERAYGSGYKRGWLRGFLVGPFRLFENSRERRV
jgi:hypothetical protein